MPEFGDTAKYPAALAVRTDFGHPMDNFARVTQSGDISTTAPTSLTIVEAIPALWPQVGWLTFEDSNEVSHYSAYNAGTKTFTLDVRGDQGTASTTHVSGTKVGRYLTKQDINQVVAELIAIETALGINFGFDGTNPAASAVGDAAVVGTATAPSHRDHKHAREAFGTPGSSAVGDSAAAGSSASLPHLDHVHGRESFATPAVVLGTAGAAGAATTPIRSDSTIAAFDATVPVTQAFADAAATGSVAFAARRDHKHGMPAAPSNSNATADASTTSLAATDTDITGASLSLGAGTWLVIGYATVYNGGSGSIDQYAIKMWNGTTTYASAGSAVTAQNGADDCVSMAAVIVLGSTTTVKLTGQASGSHATVRGTTSTGGFTSASGIRAIKLI